MVVGVVAYDVPLCRHAADDVRRGFDHVPHHKEGRRGIVLFQRVQNRFGIAVFIAAVKREVNDLPDGVPHVPRIVLRQKFRRGIADRRLPLLREGQAPVIGGDGDGGVRGGGQGRGRAAAKNPGQSQTRQQKQKKDL